MNWFWTEVLGGTGAFGMQLLVLILCEDLEVAADGR